MPPKKTLTVDGSSMLRSVFAPRGSLRNPPETAEPLGGLGHTSDKQLLKGTTQTLSWVFCVQTTFRDPFSKMHKPLVTGLVKMSPARPRQRPVRPGPTPVD